MTPSRVKILVEQFEKKVIFKINENCELYIADRQRVPHIKREDRHIRGPMIKINIPASFIPERSYIIDILFSEILGIKYNIAIFDKNYYEIILENMNKFIIKDHFFSEFEDGLDYIHQKNIPHKIIFIKNQFLPEDDFPVIYGNDELIINDGKIICGVDIFSSAFFMLSRWEEYANKTRDTHNRFPAHASLAYKNNFLDRPIVNEYLEMLWNMLLYLGIQQERATWKYELVLTHDVDEIFLWKNWPQVFRVFGGDLLKRRDFLLGLERLAEFYLIKRGKINDPYDTFDWLMDKSEAMGIRSRFYFLCGGMTRYDIDRYGLDNQIFLSLIQKIKERGHIIGVHPSYDSYNNCDLWQKERNLLEKIANLPITEGRQHYLRFEVPITWKIWDDNKMERDSTCTYAEKEGFRCGICNEYSVFNILSRKKLKLKEMPLIVMDGSLIDYQEATTNCIENRIYLISEQIRKYNGKFVMLWHNANSKTQNSHEFASMYRKIIKSSLS